VGVNQRKANVEEEEEEEEDEEEEEEEGVTKAVSLKLNSLAQFCIQSAVSPPGSTYGAMKTRERE